MYRPRLRTNDLLSAVSLGNRRRKEYDMKLSRYMGALFLGGAGLVLAGACGDDRPEECKAAADCPGVDTPCRARACVSGACTFKNVADLTPAGAQESGDCLTLVCDGRGIAKLALEPEKTPCSEGGGAVCNAEGGCVECVDAADCADKLCMGNRCLPGTCADMLQNGMESDVDCGGACLACADGGKCTKASECLSGVCTGGLCQSPTCGDGVRQSAAEQCDDGNVVPGDGCSNCTLDVAFFDDFEKGGKGWTHQVISTWVPPEIFPDTWSISTAKHLSGTHSYHSGVTSPYPGDLRLTSPPIDLTGYGQGEVLRLSYAQLYHFDDCNDPDRDTDGAIIEVLGGPEPLAWTAQLFPESGYPDWLDDNTCGNPLQGLPAFTHDTGNVFQIIEADLSQYAGQVIRIAFHVGYDCDFCDIKEGWFIDDVKVFRVP